MWLLSKQLDEQQSFDAICPSMKHILLTWGRSQDSYYQSPEDIKPQNLFTVKCILFNDESFAGHKNMKP